MGFLQRSQQHPMTAHLSRVAGSQTSQSIPCIPALFLPHLLAAQPLVLSVAWPAVGTVPGEPGTDAVPLPTVCMFMEESSLGRQHWRQNLAPLLQRLATTLHWVLHSQPTPGGTWGYLVVRVRAEFRRRGKGSVPARTGTCWSPSWALAAMSRKDEAHGAVLNGEALLF